MKASPFFLPLYGGLKQGTDGQLLLPSEGQLQLENSIVDADRAIIRRDGTESIEAKYLDGTSMPAIWRLTGRGADLVALTDADAPVAVHVPARGRFAKIESPLHGRSEYVLSDHAKQGAALGAPDSASLTVGGKFYRATSWVDSDGTPNILIQDGTGAPVYSEAIGGGVAQAAKVVAKGNRFTLVYSFGGLSRVNARVVDPAGNVSPFTVDISDGSLDVHEDVPMLDAIPVPGSSTTIVVAYRTDGDKVGFANFIPATGAFQTGEITDSGAASLVVKDSLAWVRDLGGSGKLSLVVANNETYGIGLLWNLTLGLPFASYALGGALGTSRTILQLAAYTRSSSSAGDVQCVFELADSGIPLRDDHYQYLAVTGKTPSHVVTTSYWTRSLQLTSAPFLYRGRACLLAAYDSEIDGFGGSLLQTGLYLLEIPATSSGEPAATPQACFSVGNGAPSASFDGFRGLVASPATGPDGEPLIAVRVRVGGNVNDDRGIRFVSFPTPDLGHDVNAADALHVPGGVLGAFDGETFKQVDFPISPRGGLFQLLGTPNFTVTAGGGLTGNWTGGGTGPTRVLVADANGTFTIDGITPTINQTILLFTGGGSGGVATTDYGIYELIILGDGGTQAVLRRAANYNETAEVINEQIVGVTSGTLHGGKQYRLTGWTNGTTIDTAAMIWTLITPAGSMTPSSSYFYAYCFKRTDKNGRIYRSGTYVFRVNTGASDTGIRHWLACYPLDGTVGDVEIELYRSTAADPTILHLLGTVPNHPQLSHTKWISPATGADYDDIADASIVANEDVYTTGGVLDNAPIGGVRDLVLHLDRAWAPLMDDRRVLAFSKPIDDVNGLEWTFGGTVKMRAPVTGCASFGGHLIVFTEDGTFYIPKDAGPDAAGRGSFPEPLTIAEKVTTAEILSPLVTPAAVLFKATDPGGGFFGVTKALSINPVGVDVAGYSGQRITGALALATAGQARYYTDDAAGVTLVYDWIHDLWSTFTPQRAISAAAWLGAPVYVSSVYACCEVETAGVWTEGTTPDLASVAYDQAILSAWWQQALTKGGVIQSVRGYFRLRELQGVGATLGAHTLTVQVLKDFDLSAVVAERGGSPGSKWNWKMKGLGKMSAFALRITVRGTTAGPKINGVTAAVAAKEGLARVGGGKNLR